jgi:hypothetical protein
VYFAAVPNADIRIYGTLRDGYGYDTPFDITLTANTTDTIDIYNENCGCYNECQSVLTINVTAFSNTVTLNPC